MSPVNLLINCNMVQNSNKNVYIISYANMKIVYCYIMDTKLNFPEALKKKCCWNTGMKCMDHGLLQFIFPLFGNWK